jgi:hypothetical protein
MPFFPSDIFETWSADILGPFHISYSVIFPPKCSWSACASALL